MTLAQVRNFIMALLVLIALGGYFASVIPASPTVEVKAEVVSRTARSGPTGNVGILICELNSGNRVSVELPSHAAAQIGDRVRLLNELYRVLKPGGRLIVVERIQSANTQWLAGVGGLSGWNSAEIWQELLQDAHFQVGATESINPLLTAFQAIKPRPKPLQLELPIFSEQKVGQRSLYNQGR